MDVGVSPSWTPGSPTILQQGQALAYQYQNFPDAAMYDPNNETTAFDMSGEGFGLQRRSTEQWTGVPIHNSSTAGLCPDCKILEGRIMWNGLNVFIPPWKNSSNGNIIPIYGKTPKSYFRDVGKVDYYTLVMRSCGECHKWWYHYLFHTSTQDGRKPVQAATQMPETGSLTPPPLTHSRSTPGRTSGDITQSLWSPAPTLVAEPSPAYPKPHRNSTGNRKVVIHQGKPSSTKWATPTSVRACADPSEVSPTLFPAPKVDASLPVSRSKPSASPVPSNTSRAHPTLNVRTDFPPDHIFGPSQTPWSQFNARTNSPAMPGLSPLAPSAILHSPCGFSPAVPTPSAYSAISPAADRQPSPSGVSPTIRRAPTRPLSPPPKKVQRDPETYLEMRKQLACDDCRRRKKKCHPSHPGIRRPWPQRLDKKEKGAASGGERSTSGSPADTPDLQGGEGWDNEYHF